MMDFGIDFDDDLFLESKTAAYDSSAASWRPRACDPKWFLTVDKGPESDKQDVNQAQQFLCENPVIELKKFQANLHYSTGNFREAVAVFSSLCELLPPTNLVSKRETYEGLARSFVKLGRFEEAHAAALEMKSSCKSKVHLVNYHLLSAMIHHVRRDFPSEARDLQRAIDYFQLNPDLWLRLALSYAAVENVQDFEFLPEQHPENLKAAACLLRSYMILRCVAGTVQSFAKTRNQQLSCRLKIALKKVPDWFQSKAQTAMCRDVYNSDLREKRDFQDLGSSKTKQQAENEDSEECPADADVNKFEEKWFSWIDTNTSQ